MLIAIVNYPNFHFIPVSKVCKSFSHPQSLLSPPKTYNLFPTAAIAAEDLACGTSPPVKILLNELESMTTATKKKTKISTVQLKLRFKHSTKIAFV